MTDPQTWLSITQYGRAYNADAKTVHKWITAGLVEVYRVDRFIRVKNLPPKERRSPTRPTR